MTMMLDEASEPLRRITAKHAGFLKNIPEKAQNDAVFKEEKVLLEKPSDAQFLSQFKEIVEVERKKTSACLGRIAHDKTRSQMKLMELKKTYGVILGSGGKADGNLLLAIEEHKTFIRHCLEQSTLARDRLLRLEASLKTALLSKSVSEHPENTILEISKNSTAQSKNQCGFWHQASKQRFVSEQQEATCESIPNNRM